MQIACHLVRMMERHHQLFLCGQHIARIAQHQTAFLRQHDAMIKTVEQRHIQLFFELPDLRGYGGLRIAEPFTGRRKAGIFAHRHECPQHIEIHKKLSFYKRYFRYYTALLSILQMLLFIVR